VVEQAGRSEKITKPTIIFFPNLNCEVPMREEYFYGWSFVKLGVESALNLSSPLSEGARTFAELLF
jgi:hypothetical protein